MAVDNFAPLLIAEDKLNHVLKLYETVVHCDPAFVHSKMAIACLQCETRNMELAQYHIDKSFLYDPYFNGGFGAQLLYAYSLLVEDETNVEVQEQQVSQMIKSINNALVVERNISMIGKLLEFKNEVLTAIPVVCEDVLADFEFTDTFLNMMFKQKLDDIRQSNKVTFYFDTEHNCFLQRYAFLDVMIITKK